MQNIAGWFMMKKTSFEKGSVMRAWKMHLVVKLQCTFFSIYPDQFLFADAKTNVDLWVIC